MTFYAYLRSLIDGDTNDDVKDFGAILFYWVLAGICIVGSAAMVYCKQWNPLLMLIGSIMSFIFVLLGLKTYKEVKTYKKDGESKTNP